MYYYLSFTKINLYTYYNKNKHKLKKQFTIFIFFEKNFFYPSTIFLVSSLQRYNFSFTFGS